MDSRLETLQYEIGSPGPLHDNKVMRIFSVLGGGELAVECVESSGSRGEESWDSLL